MKKIIVEIFYCDAVDFIDLNRKVNEKLKEEGWRIHKKCRRMKLTSGNVRLVQALVKHEGITV